MREALFTLGPKGKHVLEKADTTETALERHPPKQLEHMTGINDIRIAAEMTGRIAYFFAAWELLGIGWQHQIVPDAVFRIGDCTFAVEYDRGLEGLRYFISSKTVSYRRGLPGFPLAAVLVVVDREVRMRALGRAIADDRGHFLFTTLDLIRRQGILSPIFYRNPGCVEGLPRACSLELFSRQDGPAAPNCIHPTSYEESLTTS